MSTLDDLIKEIPNVDLRRRIAEEVKALRSTKKFGLVFDPHQPECTPLYDTPIKRDSIVALKAGKLDDLYRVQNIDGDNVNCLKEPQTNETYSFKLDELVSVARFGEPIYPYLQQLDKVINAPDSELWHILIESENYTHCNYSSTSSLTKKSTVSTSTRRITLARAIGMSIPAKKSILEAIRSTSV